MFNDFMKYIKKYYNMNTGVLLYLLLLFTVLKMPCCHSDRPQPSDVACVVQLIDTDSLIVNLQTTSCYDKSFDDVTHSYSKVQTTAFMLILFYADGCNKIYHYLQNCFGITIKCMTIRVSSSNANSICHLQID